VNTLQNTVNTKVSQGEVNTFKAHLESLELDASDPSLPYNLSGATIVAESPAVNNSQRAEGLFDNYANPYTPGPQNGSLWNVQHQKPFVVINANLSIRVARVTLYKRHTGDIFNNRWPKKFDVFSGTSRNGPWVLRGTANWAGAYSLTVDASQAVILAAATTAQIWRLEVSGHDNAMSELSEAVFRTLPSGDDSALQSQVDNNHMEININRRRLEALEVTPVGDDALQTSIDANRTAIAKNSTAIANLRNEYIVAFTNLARTFGSLADRIISLEKIHSPNQRGATLTQRVQRLEMITSDETQPGGTQP